MTIKQVTALLLTILQLARIGESADFRCYTPRDAIPGCTCTDGWVAKDFVYKTTVKCNEFNGTSDEFKDYLWRLNGRAVDDLIITDYPNARLPGDVFPNTVSIKRIVIADSPELIGFGPKLKPDKTFFANLGHSLESIVVHNCPNVDDREWVNIGETLAKGNAVPVLKHLTIGSDNNYLIADPKAFAKLANIETLTLRANALTTFAEDLTAFKALRFLDLTANRQLKTFNPPALPNTLTNILLAETAITRLAHETIAMLKHVDFVDLRKNPLSCYCEDIQEICDREDLQRKFVGALCATPIGKNNTIFGTSCEWEFPPSTKPPTTVATESSDTNGTTVDPDDDTASQTFAKFLYRLVSHWQ